MQFGLLIRISRRLFDVTPSLTPLSQALEKIFNLFIFYKNLENISFKIKKKKTILKRSKVFYDKSGLHK